MKQYRIDELRPEDHEKIEAYLNERFGPSQMEGLYWVPLEDDLLDVVQEAHRDCQPFCFAVELKPTAISFESTACLCPCHSPRHRKNAVPK